ncbi:bifunctional nicotinamide-nucleotide adenylyltransferase/Nudix hydroxylase [Chitinimonas lacunae]|uniref:Bifunctional nicotinamide-nucleotide adenylyltransferase/Nudix hydroxylase n=1 Tax=Chitinimonas lacunae TaxID=1963018 RepID=A0ABV8ML39_9NEIS
MIDLIVYIGRFQPAHSAHLSVIRQALKQARHLLVLAGSANKSRNIKNPFLVEERAVMLSACLPEAERERLTVLPLNDHLYNEEVWLAEVQEAVKGVAERLAAKQIAIIGCEKDDSSYYLRCFPQWTLINYPYLDGMDATEIRRLYFDQPSDGDWMRLTAMLPAPVLEFMKSFSRGKHYPKLVEEYRFIEDYRAAWAVAPYPPTFVTVDCVVVHSGHVLLVKRAADPGRGLWALPGGFLDQRETVEAAALRELKEETRIKLPLPVLRGAIRASRLFDHPDRSLRGRTLTQAFYLLFPAGEMPPVKGGDDAKAARWVPLADLRQMEREFFEDHLEIIQYFTGTL